MPRRREVPKREILPDPRHGSTMAAKFINSIMNDGKKSTAEASFYQAMDLIEERSGQSGLTVFKQAVANAKPVLEVKSRRVGGGQQGFLALPLVGPAGRARPAVGISRR